MQPRVLIVDDDRDTVEVLRMVVRRLGLAPQLATDPRVALTLMQEQDILLTDMDFQTSLTGRDVALLFKLYNPHGYVILMSGSDRIHEPVFDIQLVKPTFMGVLMDALEHALCRVELLKSLHRTVHGSLDQMRDRIQQSRKMCQESRALVKFSRQLMDEYRLHRAH